MQKILVLNIYIYIKNGILTKKNFFYIINLTYFKNKYIFYNVQNIIKWKK